MRRFTAFKAEFGTPEAQCPALFPQVSPPRLGTTATAWFDRVDAVNVNLSPRDGKRGTRQLNQNASNVWSPSVSKSEHFTHP